MKGYKVFEWYWKDSGWDGWGGPYFKAPSHWDIRAGSILTEPSLDIDYNQECGKGVNFYTNKRDALALARDIEGLVVVYEGETTENADVIVPSCNTEGRRKVRTDEFKLLKRIAVFVNGKRVSRARTDRMEQVDG